VLLILLIFSTISLSAIDLDTALAGLPPQAIEDLKADGEAYRLDREHLGIMLLPDNPMAQNIRLRTGELNPDVFTEGLYLIPYPEGKDSIDLEIYNLTRQVSAISEVIYLSHRKKDYVPLFDNVYAVSDPKKKRRIDDPLLSLIPTEDTVYLHMKETNLGSALYKVDYLWDGEDLGFFMENLGALRFLIKVVGKNNMQISMIFMPTDEGFLVYGSCGVKLSNSNTVFNMMDPYTGFYRRLYAMETWVYNTMHGSDRLPDLKTPLDF
jgi:hypothetical protein